MYAKLRGEGFAVNHKRIERIWREHGFTLPHARKRKKVRTGETRAGGRHVPEPRVDLRLHVRRDTSGAAHEGAHGDRRVHARGARDRAGQVADVLRGQGSARQALRRARQARPRSGRDNGPEFIAFELTEWLEAQGATTHHIEPGKPWQNSFAESFNNRVRDECLNMNEFWSIEHARVVLEAWRIEFNTEHPHSSLGYMTPEQFAASWGAA